MELVRWGIGLFLGLGCAIEWWAIMRLLCAFVYYSFDRVQGVCLTFNLLGSWLLLSRQMRAKKDICEGERLYNLLLLVQVIEQIEVYWHAD